MKSTRLNLFDLTMIVVSLVIGMGIFRTPVNVARQAGSANMFFLAWIIGGLIALCGALTYAEIGSRLPVTGGYYKIFSYCYHPSIAFAINCIILVSNAASLAGVALIGSEYLANVLFKGSSNINTIKLVISTIAVITFYGVNLLGLKMSARTQNVLTVIKIGVVVFLISALFTGDYATTYTPTPAAPADFMSVIKAFGACLVAVSFTYGGYQQTINFGGEVANPSKILPKGIFFGIAIIMLLYITINYTYYKVIGFGTLKGAQSIAAILAGKLFGEKGFTILSVLLFLSVLAYVNVLLMSNPRVMYAMSDEGVLPAVFKKVSAKRNVIVVSLTAFAALSLITLFYGKSFDEILNHTIFLDSIGMATSAATIFILRKRGMGGDEKNSYRMRLYPLLPLIFIAAYLFIGTSIAINTPKAAWVSALTFAVFFALYFVLRIFKKSPQPN
ncbi:serine/threonine protein kinase [Niastella yeongjuensis]|uniref:Serine/threonine protein kinase n=1 Tax=Niastella yeongjuensis TaxID=354355 RepID=A0A1V9EY49_9BACT|nr:APC family permease [Niastella yeongjuensis]OQP50895.1 serine/threonine protein kinase [Niastella yeongjuensis]SEN12693.1 basic amino acid/polyamine antiporter, APA family [Niastella yeongjuensis]